MRLATNNAFAGLCLHRLRTFTNLFKENPKSVVPCLFTLHKGEVFQIPSACREVKVLSGIAWITVAGEDVFLSCGEKALLASNKDFAIVSALTDVPLMLEAL